MEHITIQKLVDLGLQENEAKVYVAMLGLGNATATAIAQNANLNRTTVYDVVERLSMHGLVHRIAGNKRMYAAEPPYRLRQYLERKKRSAERRLKEVENLIPGLSEIYKTDLKPVVKFAQGKKEMNQMYLRKLEAKSTICSILNLKGYSEDFDEMGKVTSRERYKRGIKERVLALKSDVAYDWWKEVYKNSSSRQRNTEYRWLEPTMNDYPNGEVMIFDDTVLIMLTKPGEYVGFEIISSSLASFLKILFELSWNSVSHETNSVNNIEDK